MTFDRLVTHGDPSVGQPATPRGTEVSSRIASERSTARRVADPMGEQVGRVGASQIIP